MIAPSRSSSAQDSGGGGLAQCSDWNRRVAGFLGMAAPVNVHVKVHAGRGVPYVQDDAVHLFRDSAGRADIAQLPHELVHLVAGHSPSRFLAEGLAVHVDASLRLGRPAWPCYLSHPDTWVVDLLSRGQLGPLAPMVAEMTDVRLSAGLTPERIGQAWRLYVVAGSFVAYLLSREGGRFWAGYRAGRCWDDEAGLAVLESGWLASLPPTMSPEAVASLAGSRDAASRDLGEENGR